jgi:hypothetical protein
VPPLGGSLVDCLQVLLMGLLEATSQNSYLPRLFRLVFLGWMVLLLAHQKFL